jgi:TRAP-type mannitol/chloroaromatic compound transport system permease small subunit
MILQKLLAFIDHMVGTVGKLTSWLIIFLIFEMTYDVIARYLFNAPTKWSFDISTMILATLIIVGMPFVSFEKGHVSVDIIKGRFHHKLQLVIDLFFTLVMFFPLMYVLLISAWRFMIRSWVIKEFSTVSYWEPVLYPLRTIVFIGIVLLALEGIVQFIRNFHLLLTGKEL